MEWPSVVLDRDVSMQGGGCHVLPGVVYVEIWG